MMIPLTGALVGGAIGGPVGVIAGAKLAGAVGALVGMAIGGIAGQIVRTSACSFHSSPAAGPPQEAAAGHNRRRPCDAHQVQQAELSISHAHAQIDCYLRWECR